MRRSLLLAALILAAAALASWRNQRQITTLRAERRQLAATAAQLGVAPDDPATAHAASRPTATRDQQLRRQQARDLARDIAAFLVDLKARQKERQPNPPDLEKQISGLLARLLELDSSQLKALIDEVRGNPALDQDTRQGIVGFALATLAQDHPAEALALATEGTGLFANDQARRGAIQNALQQWAARDPQAALEWFRQQSAARPELVSDPVKQALIAGSARQDPALAFQLARELAPADLPGALRGIASSAKSPEERAAVLQALRQHLDLSGKEPAQAAAQTHAVLAPIAGNLAREGFDSARSWLAANELTDNEMGAFASGLSWHQTKADTGRWVETLGESLPAAQAEGKIRELVSEWTRQDYRAAGTWLNQSPEGPAKNSSVRAYAATVAPYDPTSAAQWALTLPADSSRAQLLSDIHRQWQSQDPAAAARFAAEHDLK